MERPKVFKSLDWMTEGQRLPRWQAAAALVVELEAPGRYLCSKPMDINPQNFQLLHQYQADGSFLIF